MTKNEEDVMTYRRDEVEYYPKYWICDSCAALKGWTVCPWPHTVVCNQRCGWCKSGIVEPHLTPTDDFNGPDGKRAVWD